MSPKSQAKGTLAKAYDKAATWQTTVEQSERMQRTAQQISGCKMEHPTWNGNNLTGFLNCESR